MAEATADIWAKADTLKPNDACALRLAEAVACALALALALALAFATAAGPPIARLNCAMQGGTTIGGRLMAGIVVNIATRF